jgi:hypothetical protein
MATTTTTIGNNKQRASDNETSCARAQHIHIDLRNCDDHINYGNKVDKVDNKALYIAPQDGDDVNNNGNKIDKVDNKTSYITLPDRRGQ